MARLDDRLDREFDPRTAKVLAKALDVHNSMRSSHPTSPICGLGTRGIKLEESG